MSLTQQPYRFLVALPRGKGRVFLAWRLLAQDGPDIPFHIERRRGSGEDWVRITAEPIVDSTSFLDETPEKRFYEYRVVSLPRGALWPSDTVTVDAGAEATIKAVNAPLMSQAKSTHHLVAGELFNDSRMGFVCTCFHEGQHFLDAYASDGRSLWGNLLAIPHQLPLVTPAAHTWHGLNPVFYLFNIVRHNSGAG